MPLTGWFRNGFGDVVEQALNLARDYAQAMRLANGHPGYSNRRHLTDGDTIVVAAGGSGNYDPV